MVLCLGEARVELVCQRPVARVADADAFVPAVGGTGARVAVAAAQVGARVALAGVAGEDDWGRWLRARLADAGVDVSRFELRAETQTPLALVAVSPEGEPAWTRYGATSTQDGDWPGAMSALFVGLSDPSERDGVMRARALALEHGLPVIFAPRLRVEAWRSGADAAASANACVPGALLVRVSAGEAALLTGEDDPERAALALVKAGARMVVVTLGGDGAILRGELRAEVDGVPARVVSKLGAGDAFTGVLLGRLAASGFYPPVVAASLREAAVAGARECERW